VDSKALVFLGLVSGPRQYRIPPFQRPYSWEKEDRETLWLDILTQYQMVERVWGLEEAAREEAMAKVSTHYLGTIVLSGPSSLGVPKSDIIDGQQRITTLLLAVCALRDQWGQQLARTAGAEAAAAKRQTISNTYLLNDGQDGRDRYRVLPLSADEKTFKACVDYTGSGKLEANEVGLDPGDSPRMLQAYKFFRTEMARKKVGEGNAQLSRFASLYPLDPEILEQVIAHRLSVIAIETKNLDNTNSIFESLNAKGRPLTQLDLLRNYVFMCLGARAGDVLASEWDPIEKIHLPDRKDLDAFVWAEVVSRGANVLQKRTYRTVQAELRTAGAGADAAKDYVARLHRRAPVFARLLDPSKEPQPAVADRLARLDRAGGKTARPVVLWLYEEQHDGRCTHEDIGKCVAHLESFVVRRFLNAMPPNNLNSMFGIMLSRLNNDPTYGPDAGSVEERLLAVLHANPREWPDDATLVEGVLKHDFYHSGDVRQRMHVLRSLDLDYGYSLPPSYEESDKSIEHVLPQASAAPGWVTDLKSLGQELAAVQERWLHTLGNLSVVAPAENSSLGQKRFAEKVVIYADIDYKMTKELATLGQLVAGEILWGEAEIEDRGRRLADRCCTLWLRAVPATSFAIQGAAPDSVDGDEFDIDDDDEAVPFTSSIAEEDE
jgi:hypothetical protein